jgi:hypothetical protein
VNTPQQDLEVIKQSVRELALHPRFKHKSFGYSGALETVLALYKYLEANPGTRWPEKDKVMK